MGLAKLYRESHGSNSDNTDSIWTLYGLREPSVYSSISSNFWIKEPTSVPEISEREGSLVSSKLYSLPFPESEVPNMYYPSYIKPIQHEEYPIHPDYKYIPNIDSRKRKRKKGIYYRSRY